MKTLVNAFSPGVMLPPLGENWFLRDKISEITMVSGLMKGYGS